MDRIRSRTRGHSASDSLLRFLLVVAGVSIVTILALTSYGMYRVYSGEIVEQAEQDAVEISRGILASNDTSRLLFTGSGERQRLNINPDEIESLDGTLAGYLAAFDIVKIKIYDPEGTIAYSTDPGIIGEVDEGNERLARALDGENDSKVERKEEVQDLAAEARFDVDVVETYVPLRNEAGTIVGSFEIYQDITSAKAAINRTVAVTSGILLAILALVYGLSFAVVRKATGRLHEAQTALEVQAKLDSLTGLSNRRAIFTEARAEHNRMIRHQPDTCSLALVLIDVDNFKQINDAHGHHVGDEVLVELGRRFRVTLRGYDKVGRYGGEEFLALLPETRMQSAAVVAERLRRAVGEVPFESEKGPLHVTISLGVALSHPDDRTIDDALKRADAALYIAKDQGRNRVGCLEADIDLRAAVEQG